MRSPPKTAKDRPLACWMGGDTLVHTQAVHPYPCLSKCYEKGDGGGGIVGNGGVSERRGVRKKLVEGRTKKESEI